MYSLILGFGELFVRFRDGYGGCLGDLDMFFCLRGLRFSGGIVKGLGS